MRASGGGSGVGSREPSIVDVPRAVGMAIGGDARRAVDGSHPKPRVRRPPGGVEGGVLDVVTHGDHELLAHRLDVHQGAAVVEVEQAVVVVDDRVAEVHELGGCADVELHAT